MPENDPQALSKPEAIGVERSSEHLTTLAKGLRVLTSFSRETPSMTLSEVAKKTGLNAAVARRCLLTLCDLGYVGKLEGRFTLRPEVLVFATLFNETFDLDNTIRPALQELRSKTDHSASFTVITGGDVLYIAHTSTHRVLRLQANTGTRFPALLTSTGRSILSTWQDHEIRQFINRYPVAAMTNNTVTAPDAIFSTILAAREQGYAFISDELEYGITSLAVPVHVSGYGVVGAVNSSATTSQIDVAEFVQERLDELQRTAEKIGRRLKTAPDLLGAIRSMAQRSQ
ncbi:MAG: IclR family transcriptional regulator domain-containing protein [Luminiphilus sp.]